MLVHECNEHIQMNAAKATFVRVLHNFLKEDQLFCAYSAEEALRGPKNAVVDQPVKHNPECWSLDVPLHEHVMLAKQDSDDHSSLG